MRIPDGSSIFTAEAKAIDLALDLIADCETSNKFIIFSDSLSVLKSIDHTVVYRGCAGCSYFT